MLFSLVGCNSKKDDEPSTIDEPQVQEVITDIQEEVVDNENVIETETIEETQEETKTVNPTRYSYWVVVYDQLGNELSRTVVPYGTIVKDPDGNEVFVDTNKYFHTYINYDTPSTPVNTDATFIYKDKNGNSKTQKIPSGTTVIIDVGNGTITGLTSITVTNNQTVDLTIDDYIPTPSSGYKFLGYKYDSSTKKFIAEYDDTVYKILYAKTIYTDGEPACLEDAENSVITINGIDCYVLKVNGNKAELITKGIYDVRFDDGGHTEGDVMNYVGVDSIYYGDFSDKTYRYDYSTLRTWMDNFYSDYLGSDSRILDTTVTSYYGSSSNTITQKTYAIDQEKARTYFSKFVWDGSVTFIDNKSVNATSFWTSGGWKDSSNWSLGVIVTNDSYYQNTPVTAKGAGARPAFWISLD